MKAEHEGRNGPALAKLGAVSDDQLTDLLLEVFARPVERLNGIADQLERTGAANANAVAELKQIIRVLADAPVAADTRTATALAFAADVFGNIELERAARSLGYAADTLDVIELARVAQQLSRAAERITAAMDQAGGRW